MTRALLLSATLVAAALTARTTAQPPAPSAAEHFKYGSVGIESEEGLPYWIWQALPRLFPDLLPNGYASLGFVWEPGRELPIGFSRRDVLGSARVAVNCAFCHTATYRTAPGAARVLVPGGAATIAVPQAYSRVLEAAAADPRFTASRILAAAGEIGSVSWFDALAYRVALVPGTRRALRRHREEFRWMDSRPAWGPGRIDSINPFKFRQLRQPIDESIGTSDMTPLWALGLRDGRAFHWDGINPALREVLLGSAIGNGASVKSVDVESVETVSGWVRGLPPPPYPFPTDAGLAARGREIFAAECGACHAVNGPRMGAVIPIAEVGTDRHRLDAWTTASATAFNDLAAGKPWQFRSFRKTDGYVAMPLAGAWLNAPYLHNGSVPTMADLLEPPERRPARFFRGYDVYDPARMGFVSAGPDAEREGMEVDTRQSGNGNGGHAYGTALAPEAKAALLEYLKTQ